MIQIDYNYCPAVAGPSVYWARNFRNSYERGMTYDDANCGGTDALRRVNTDWEEETMVELFPNPASDRLNILMNSDSYQIKNHEVMKEELKNRTKVLSIRVIRLVETLPNKPTCWAITNQIIRSSTSIAANYRAVCRAKSDKDFISKMGTVIEEADETLFWLELIEELGIIKDLDENKELKFLQKEANELISIFVASSKTIKQRVNSC